MVEPEIRAESWGWVLMENLRIPGAREAVKGKNRNNWGQQLSSQKPSLLSEIISDSLWRIRYIMSQNQTKKPNQKLCWPWWLCNTSDWLCGSTFPRFPLSECFHLSGPQNRFLCEIQRVRWSSGHDAVHTPVTHLPAHLTILLGGWQWSSDVIWSLL